VDLVETWMACPAPKEENELQVDALHTVLEIFATSLGMDDNHTKVLRQRVGGKLIPILSRDLGRMVDDLLERSAGKKARELQMDRDEQRQLTLLVRVLGNLCFQSEVNQDLLRTTLVPHQPSKDRNALHLLLTCTSFATSCFTLREWGVMAIRNALDENPRNQEMVAGLESQNAVQTTALRQAGVKVELDAKGKVSLSTIDE